MKAISLGIAALVVLLAGVFAGWHEPYHAIVGATTLALAVVALWRTSRWWRLRNAAEEEPDEEEDEDHPIILICAKGAATGVALVVVLLACFALARATPLYGWFHPCQHLPAEVVSDFEAWEKGHDWVLIIQGTDGYLDPHDSPSCVQREAAEWRYNAFKGWGGDLPACLAIAKFEKAVETGRAYGLDTEVAEARAGEAEAQCQPSPTPSPTPTPVVLQPGCRGRISGTDTQNYPPALALYVEAECPTTGGTGSAAGDFTALKNLADKDFRATAGGQPADVWIGSVPDQRAPLRVVLLIDSSGSMAGLPIEQAKEGAQTFIETLSGDDQLAVIAFDDSVSEIQAWTQGKDAALSALAALEAGGETLLYDGLSYAIDMLGPASGGRRVVVLLTDGTDTGSVHGLDETIQYANASGIPVYAIGLASSEDYDSVPLARLANEAGGVLLETTDAERLSDLYTQIAGKIEQAYRVLVKIEDWPAASAMHLTIVVGGGETAIRLEKTVQRGPEV